MKIADMNWMQVEAYLQHDDRCVLPIGSTEQHAYLSLATDNLLAERISRDAADSLNIPVFPVLNYGMTPYFRAYPGSVTLRMDTYIRLIRDILDSLAEQGFKRILVVNGHGGNIPAQGLYYEWQTDHPGVRVKWHNWWNAPKTWAKVMEIDPLASHASWMENFPWTRLMNVEMPTEPRPMVDVDRMRQMTAPEVREYLGTGNYAGLYQRSDDDMLAIWQVAIKETRALLTDAWV